MEKSESIKELATALAKTQGQLTSAKKGAVNPFFKSSYADLATIWDICRKPLSDNGLAVIQITNETGEKIILETILCHTSGEWIKGSLPLNPVKSDPQGIGSALTYARRYGLSAMIGITADEDDDAEGAMGRAKTPELPIPEKSHGGSASIVPYFLKTEPEHITEPQQKKIYAASKGKDIDN